ncbi:MAG: efflux RND transporter permease subunit, partial [Deltaproteobacteria bacterium]|nr:efflux RND transporter permease subunit [Deltaproteobacteria bacterium]
MFTSDLSYAILGDLAKTVVFSHVFSALVALVLVPTVRLHLMTKTKESLKHISPIEGTLSTLETFYGKTLSWFILHTKAKWVISFALIGCLAFLCTVILPRLPKEMIGTPDSDWMVLSINTNGNSLMKQMESQTDEIEAKLLKEFGPRIQYTFTQINELNSAVILARLKNKKEMNSLWKTIEKAFPNTPTTHFWIGPWNPAELPIPDPPTLRVAVRGGEPKERARLTHDLLQLLEENQVFPRLWTEPNTARTEVVAIKPYPEVWKELKASRAVNQPEVIADFLRVLTQGKTIGNLSINGKNTDIFIKYANSGMKSSQDLEALPIVIGSKLVPLKALAQFQMDEVLPTIYRENGKSLFILFGKKDKGVLFNSTAALVKAKELVLNFEKKQNVQHNIIVSFENAQKELDEALKQLLFAVLLSILLIFFTMVMQFGNVINALLVLISVPLGIIGVLISLFIFKSPVSLNSVLGIILLNGISVANSIILVDFTKKLVNQGHQPIEAAILAGQKRLRPILITSLTTILAMLPIAFGYGEGGKILQPLGIAVSGGLGFSTLFTLLMVPTLQASILRWKKVLPQQTSIMTKQLPLLYAGLTIMPSKEENKKQITL